MALIALVLTGRRAAAPSIPHPQSHGAAIHMHADTATHTSAQARPETIVKPVSCHGLPHVPGKSLTTAIVEFPLGAYSPKHRHPGSVTAFVLEGVVRSQLAGGPIETYMSGETWFEPPGVLHLFAENASGTEPAELLAIFVAEDNCGPLVVYEP
jgi:quercetin dioxygenase-like cupin family protein